MVQRERFRGLTALGKRFGYGLFLLTMVFFFIAIFTGFNDTWGWLMMASLVLGSALLLPAIIFGYAVKAADRHDLGLPDGH